MLNSVVAQGTIMSASIQNPNFVMRRLHSLLGLIPIGAFLVFHLWENSQSRFGPEHYNEQVVGALQGLNYLPFLEIGVIALPLLFHAALGLVIFGSGQAEPIRYSYLRNRLYWLQRISGIGILVFLVLHVGLTRIAGMIDPAVGEDLYGHMREALSQPATFVVYLLGLWLSVFHLANGLSTAGIVWGVTSSAEAQRRFGWVCLVLGLLLGAMGTHGMVGFLIGGEG